MAKTKLSILKRLAVCLGCCGDTKDIPAETNAEAIQFICENFNCKGKCCNGITRIALREDTDGKLVRGIWEDSAGEKHSIEIRH